MWGTYFLFIGLELSSLHVSFLFLTSITQTLADSTLSAHIKFDATELGRTTGKKV